MQNEQINTNEYLSNCDLKDVFSFSNEKLVSVSKLKNIVYSAFIKSGIDHIISYMANDSNFKNTNKTRTWFKEGEECEILRAGSPGWQKGKIKINVTLEFIPDEIEQDKSPLDDIRQAEIDTPQQ